MFNSKGLILVRVGSISEIHYHLAKTFTFSIKNEHTKGHKAIGILSNQGVIMVEA